MSFLSPKRAVPALVVDGKEIEVASFDVLIGEHVLTVSLSAKNGGSLEVTPKSAKNTALTCEFAESALTVRPVKAGKAGKARR